MREAPGWRALSLADVEPLPFGGLPLRWHPLRAALGTRIAGMAAFSAARAGDLLIEDHVESDDGLGHEELYVVLAGSARFELDGEELAAPAGTFVLVSPGIRRTAVASEPGTTVLALGDEPRFAPSSSEWIEQARALAREDPGRARQLIDELRAEKPDSVGVAIGEALLQAIAGLDADAVATLRTVLKADPSLRRQLAEDPDLGPLARRLVG